MNTGNSFHSHFRTISRRGRLTTVAAGAALALGVFAPLPTASAAVDTGSIAGVVTDSSEAPLAGIEVSVFDTTPFGDVLVGEAETDAAGAYAIPGIQADPYYKVQFIDPDGDYAMEFWDDAIVAPPYAKWVPVTAGNVTPDIDASLEVGNSISGRLTTATTGAPVDGGTVALWWKVAGQSYARVDTYSTGSDGRWTISGVKAATYALEFRDPVTGTSEAWNDAESLFGSTPIVLTGGDDVVGVDAQLGGVVANVSAPTVSGTPQVGQTLTAGPGAWQPSSTTVTYRWVVGDDSSPSDDPTGPTYVPTAADLGKTIRVQATGRRGAGWTPATAWSASTAPVAAAPLPPVVAPAPVLVLVNDTLPFIKGKLRVGKVVQVTKGAWTPYPKNLDYTWYAGGKVIKGAHRQWFKLTKKQVGKRLVVEVTASAPSYAPLTVTTERTKKVKR